jgi:hypothetical protein
MLSQAKLLKAIDAGMRVCRDASPGPRDRAGKEQRTPELATLTNQLEWTSASVTVRPNWSEWSGHRLLSPFSNWVFALS